MTVYKQQQHSTRFHNGCTEVKLEPATAQADLETSLEILGSTGYLIRCSYKDINSSRFPTCNTGKARIILDIASKIQESCFVRVKTLIRTNYQPEPGTINAVVTFWNLYINELPAIIRSIILRPTCEWKIQEPREAQCKQLFKELMAIIRVYHEHDDREKENFYESFYRAIGDDREELRIPRHVT